MSTIPTISVIIPNYNHASYLKQRIDSVLNQTFQDFELIILDDCSTDNSKEIIESYRGHPKISRIVYNDRNSGGVFKQWVKGIEYCKGEFIWIAESDDYSDEKFLEKTFNLINSDESVGMVFTKTKAVDNLGNPVSDSFLTKFNKETDSMLAIHQNKIDRKNVAVFLGTRMSIANASSVLFRKKPLLSLDFEELRKYKNTGDRFVYIGIALISKVLFLPEVLNFMRYHEDNTTKKNLENGNLYIDRIRALNYYFDVLNESSVGKKELAWFYKEQFFHFMKFATYVENMVLLKNIKQTKEISFLLYYLLRWYLYLFKKLGLKSKVLRGIYYRVLLIWLK